MLSCPLGLTHSISSMDSNAAHPITLLLQAHFHQANTTQSNRALHNVLVHLIVLSTHNIAVSDAVSAFLDLLRSWKRFLGKTLHLGRDTISNWFFLSVSLRQSSGALVDILAEAFQCGGVSLLGPCSCTPWGLHRTRSRLDPW